MITPEEIAEIAIPMSDSDSANASMFKEGKQNKIISLITTLQKETWDQACKAMKYRAMEHCGSYIVEFPDNEIETVAHLINQVPTPPFNLDK